MGHHQELPRDRHTVRHLLVVVLEVLHKKERRMGHFLVRLLVVEPHRLDPVLGRGVHRNRVPKKQS